MYGKLINGVIEYAPKDYVSEDGKVIVNFNVDVALLEKYSYKLIEDTKPSYNTETQYLEIDSYSESDDKIIINYRVKSNAITPTVEEEINIKIDNLLQQQLATEQALQDLILITMASM